MRAFTGRFWDFARSTAWDKICRRSKSHKLGYQIADGRACRMYLRQIDKWARWLHIGRQNEISLCSTHGASGPIPLSISNGPFFIISFRPSEPNPLSGGPSPGPRLPYQWSLSLPLVQHPSAVF